MSGPLRPARIAVLLLAAALGIGALVGARRAAAARAALGETLGEVSVAAQTGLSSRLERARDEPAARRELARAILFEALARRGERGDPAVQRELAVAVDLARRALAQRPASAEAAMLLGLALQLDRIEARDTAVYAKREVWEAPLRAAVGLAPGDPEPRRVLAGALLEVWFALSQSERAETKELLRQALADPPTFERLIGRWADAGFVPAEVFSIMPEAPAAWARLESLYAGAADWPAWRDAHDRHLAALRFDLERHADEAMAKLAQGDARGARRGFLQVLAQAPPSGNFADLARRAIANCPAGASDPQLAPALRAWLEWGADRFLYGQKGLTPEALDRLAGASGDLPMNLHAIAALAAGQHARADILEERAQAQWSEPWGIYLMAKARDLAARGDRAAARQIIGQVHRGWHATPSFWQTRLAIARAAEDPAAQAEAETRLQALARDEWPATAWRFSGANARLEALLAQSTRGGRLVLDVVPARGGVIEVSWDGAVVQTFAVSPSVNAVEVPIESAAGLHLLDVRTLAGERVAPGEFRLAG